LEQLTVSSFDAAPAAGGHLPVIDAKCYRQVLGQYPTGVCVVTAQLPNGEPVAMIVGSFTSVSLDPPLVAFFPDRGSSSWARLRQCEKFCVNILAADQEPVCRKLASKDPDKFTGTPHRISDRGNPIVEGVVAWIECSLHSVTDAGDHEMVLGRVLGMDVVGGGLPLLFFQGGYGRFSPASMAAEEGQGFTLAQLRDVDKARSQMDRIATNIGARCIATVRVGDELVVAASAGQARRGSSATLVGQRLPFAPPTCSVFAAWMPAAEAERWLDRRDSGETRRAAAAALDTVRRRGFSVGLINEAQRTFSDRLAAMAEGRGHPADLENLLDALSYDPVELPPETVRDVRVISAPVFDGEGRVSLALTLHDYPKPSEQHSAAAYIDQLVSAAATVTKHLGGRSPISTETIHGH
jgi:flavin reductase (DIM6/NTAB) family NADH-FMN oxidoreductase RutF